MSVDHSWSIQLVCPEETHCPIDLPHKTSVVIGRIPEMRIVDPRCSRRQVELLANCHTGEVTVKQVGSNSSALDGIELIQNKEYKMKPSSTLFVLTGLYPQKLKVENRRQTSETDKSTVKVGKKLKNGDVHLGKIENEEKKHKNNSAKSDKKKQSEKTKSKEKDKSNSEKPDKKKVSEKPKSKEKEKSTKVNEEKKYSKDEPDLSEKDGKAGRKRPSSSDSESLCKKPKLSNDTKTHDKTTNEKKSVKFCDNVDKASNNSINDDENHMNEVAAKLKALKENTKKAKSPEREDLVTESVSSGDAVTKGYWEKIDSLYVYRSKGLTGKNKIAAFDVDGTIITTQSGKVFPTHPGDWRLLYYSEIKKKFAKLHGEGFKIVFISNQLGVSRGKAKVEDLQTKFQKITAEFDIPIQVLFATKSDFNRKPCVGMWQYLCEKGNDSVPVDVSTSLYVGDAAGRAKDWQPKKKKDFSCSDRLFALNIGLKFFTPEEFFLGYPAASFTMPEFDPRKCSSQTSLLDPEDSQLCSDKQEVLVLVGSPASGKSWLVKTYFVPKGYCHINRDTLGTWQKCVSAANTALKRGESVVIDNTNPDVESRARYVEVARKAGVQCRCFVLTTSHAHARHNERFREITDKSHQPINDMILNSYKKKYVPPEKKEGFSEIVRVNCVPKFTDSKMADLYKKFLIDK